MPRELIFNNIIILLIDLKLIHLLISKALLLTESIKSIKKYRQFLLTFQIRKQDIRRSVEVLDIS